jgi:spore germination cell wall hydrolase CwlJ-like protein
VLVYKTALSKKGESNMASAISNRYYDSMIKVLQFALLMLGLCLVIFFITSITKQKLEYLRSNLFTGDSVQITAAERTKQLDCLTRNIYWEAASEPFEGKVAVAQVTMNRVAAGNFGNGVCGVVFQKNVFYEKVVCQFSWACESTHKFKPIHPKLYAESEEVAKKVLLENFRLPGLTSAIYYHADYVNPGWRKEKIIKIGRHIFYKG